MVMHPLHIIMFISDVNKRMVIQNAKTCNFNPQTLQATCNVKELLKAHHASDGTAVAKHYESCNATGCSK